MRSFTGFQVVLPSMPGTCNITVMVIKYLDEALSQISPFMDTGMVKRRYNSIIMKQRNRSVALFY
jgi:hypothetical protein